jgi:hypothetical protein
MDWLLLVSYSLNKSPTQSTSASSPMLLLQEVTGTNPKDAAKGAAVVFAGMQTLVLISGVHTTMRPRLRAPKTYYQFEGETGNLALVRCYELRECSSLLFPCQSELTQAVSWKVSQHC